MHSSSEKNQAKRQTIVKVVLLIIVIAITVLIVALGWSRFKKDSPVKQTAQTQGQTTTTPTNTPQPQTTPKPANFKLNFFSQPDGALRKRYHNLFLIKAFFNS
jgi:flagellar basal body-associated protein FliL